MPATPADASQLAAIKAAGQQLEQQMLGPTALAVVRRWAFWDSLRQSADSAGLKASDIYDLLGVPLARANIAADKDAQGFALLVGALNNGQAKLAAWAITNEQGQPGPLQLGIVKSGVDPSTLGQWQALPIILRIGAQAALAIGSWIVVNAWTHAKELEAGADQTRANTQAAISSAITKAAAQNPQAGAMLADALSRANTAASGAQPGLLDSIADSIRSVGAGVGQAASSFGGTALLLLGFWLFSRRRRA